MPDLESINDPADLRKLPRDDLPAVAAQLRAFILKTVSRAGGHLASNLGSVELAVALHYVLDTPRDFLIWDVGHQSYAHKALTGRREALARVRKQGGISGFPSRAESPYDCFGTAHASTSISAALGMAVAAKRRGEKRRAVAVIGDGALSGGMAFEALNHAGATPEIDLLVVLNDNEMSISPPVGALKNSLVRILSSRFYNRVREGGKRALAGMPVARDFARRAHEHLKGMALPGTLFEELGFNYVGPVDGHDVERLVAVLQSLVNLPGPQFLHAATIKGKGFEKAEADPVLYHGVGAFEPEKGITAPDKIETNGGKPKPKPSYAQVFGDWACAAAARDARVVAVTPAMREGSGLVEFSRRFPDRYFDVGIAEQHAVTFCGGLAAAGMRPIMAIYSTFLQRGYDQLIHDIALQNLPVIFAVDRAGIVGADGATHHGVFDLSYARCLPNLTVAAPSDENELWRALNAALALDSPALVRYPRGAGAGAAIESESQAAPLGRGIVAREGEGTAILAFGSMLAPALEAGEKIGAAVADMRFVKPLDGDLILSLADRCERIVTVEENMRAGGAGGAVAEFLQQSGRRNPLLILGLPDRFIDHGKPEELLAECGLDAAGIEKSIRAFARRNPPLSRR